MMRHQIALLSLALALSATAVVHADSGDDRDDDHQRGESSVQLGPRPFFLLNETEDGPLKRQLPKFHRSGELSKRRHSNLGTADLCAPHPRWIESHRRIAVGA